MSRVDGSGSAVDAAYELARRLSEAGVRRMSGKVITVFFNNNINKQKLLF